MGDPATKCGLVWNDPSERSIFNRLKAASVRRGGGGAACAGWAWT